MQIIRLGFQFVLPLLIGCTAAAQTPACDTTIIESKVSAWIDAIKDYHLDARVLFEGQTVHSRLAGRVPDRLSIQMNIDGQPVKFRIVFDGTNQWIEQSHGKQAEVMKIALADIVDERRPFDSTYYVMGSSLLNGEDLPGSLRTLLACYDLTAECGQESKKLSGPINPDKFRSYAKQRRGMYDEASVMRYIKTFGYLKLELKPATYQVIGYQLSAGKTAQEELFRVMFDNMSINSGVRNDEFKYRMAEGRSVIDLTPSILERIRQN